MGEKTDMDKEATFQAVALRTIEATPVRGLLRNHAAVALERLAYGGGATRWFFLRRAGQLTELADIVTPMSSLSFYFDGRIAVGPVSSEVIEEIVKIAAEDRDAVVGRLGPD